MWNLIFSLLAWACTVSNVTLVVGSSGVVVLSIGGDDSASSLPLGGFVIGSAAVSLAITPWLFRLCTRRTSFLTGLGLGFVGTIICCISIVIESLAMLVIGNFFFGMATGVGFYWRFTAVELVPPHWAARAVTLVVSGGCLAAFAGPESAQATKDMFSDDLEYMGVFVMTAVFGVLNFLFTMLVQFPESTNPKSNAIESSHSNETNQGPALTSILYSSDFLLPMIISGLAWSIMAVPMSVVRVAMHQVGYSVRQSLTVIEIHFLGMYSPGFVAGPLIKQYGPKKVCAMGGVLFAVSVICMLFAESEPEGNMGLWLVGLFVVGAGWNFAFTGATVWTANLYRKSPIHKEKVQAANDCLMFLFSGAWIFASSYIFEAGGSQLDGWKTMNYVVVGMLVVFFFVTGVGLHLDIAASRQAEEIASTAKNGTEEA
ncbi:hypothetical protein FisN_14Hh254 [Fistulifera solaris]|uniref:Major facilitator superfamily (MFS) profile domain-containing protein n=1 Tax=Fistulifera solaris TaxID=1519565 RepID=A0A1Z5K9L1_FISSO|nr:hypothetical protein FisN_14Hh254 [Fistulifera solaris]|eukprot:GAX22618.1 hypothetical protein FisN_14Hh254 [Fistulifera solaris]